MEKLREVASLYFYHRRRSKSTRSKMPKELRRFDGKEPKKVIYIKGKLVSIVDVKNAIENSDHRVDGRFV